MKIKITDQILRKSYNKVIVCNADWLEVNTTSIINIAIQFIKANQDNWIKQH